MSLADAFAAHLGWQPFGHRPNCAQPVWEVDQQMESDRRRGRWSGPEHACPNEDCGHHDRYDRVAVRLLCRSCDTVHVVSGEVRITRMTTTASIGYGQAPKRLGGLWLYPGPPMLDWRDAGPGEYLCSLKRVTRLTEEDIVGAISEGRGARGGTTWSAGALPTWRSSVIDRPYAYPVFASVNGDTTFRTVAAAAKWVKSEVDAAAGTKTKEDQDR
ncbi:hypothetical protein ACEZDB_32185 [Streptacidiphilus sp. N1-3]|uniref:Uncharacterized protein n=1 Tax=Streptacidiphilus alkalitolerans TaxID=3342712 RepID=A0ABV6XAR0_9ACTN